VGFILNAMSGDYYPRLAGATGDRPTRDRMVGEQSEMAMLLAVPALIAALVFSDFLISLLYSPRFAPASAILRWQVLGMLGRIISWPVGFLLYASGDKWAILTAEIAAGAAHVVLALAGVAYFSLPGAGAAFAGSYLVIAVLVSVAAKHRHGFKWSKRSATLVGAGASAVLGAFATTFVADATWRLAAGGAMFLSATALSAILLLKRLGHGRGIQTETMPAASAAHAAPEPSA
jgi:PST family polysaccharide transporter